MFNWLDILPKDHLPKNILPKDSLPAGHFDKWTFCRKDILPKGQLVEIKEM